MAKIGKLIGSALIAGGLSTGCIGVIATSNEPVNINITSPAPVVGGYANGYAGYAVVSPVIAVPSPGYYVPPSVNYNVGGYCCGPSWPVYGYPGYWRGPHIHKAPDPINRHQNFIRKHR